MYIAGKSSIDLIQTVLTCGTSLPYKQGHWYNNQNMMVTKQHLEECELLKHRKSLSKF
jgi:hypothetical protein